MKPTCWVCLILYAWLVQVVSADGTGVCTYRPGPHCHSVPFLHFKPLSPRLAFALFCDGLDLFFDLLATSRTSEKVVRRGLLCWKLTNTASLQFPYLHIFWLVVSHIESLVQPQRICRDFQVRVDRRRKALRFSHREIRSRAAKFRVVSFALNPLFARYMKKQD